MRLRQQVVRFLAVGVVNTVATYALFVGLGLVMSAALAYTIAFALGLCWVAFGTSTYVFGSRHPKRIVTYALWYVLVYIVGQLVIAHMSPEGLRSLLLTTGALMVVTVPLTFVGGRLILTETAHRRDDNERAMR